MTDPRGEALQPFSRQQLDATLADLKEMWAALVAVAMSVPGAKEVLVPRKDLPETIEMIFAQAATNAVPHEDLMLTIWKDGSYLCQSVEGDREVQMTTDWFVSIPLVAGYHALQSATPEVESTKVSELKRQLAAEREHGRLLQAQVDAFARPAPERSGVGVVEALDIMNGLQPATPRSEPANARATACLHACEGLDTSDLAGNDRGWLAQVVHSAALVESQLNYALRACCAGNTDDDEPVRCQSYEASEQSQPCPRGRCVMAEPEEAPQSERQASGTAKVPEGWKLVPIHPTEAMLDRAEEACFADVKRKTAFKHLKAQWREMLAAAPSPAGNNGSAT
jgi:hypothetical protein